MGDKDSSAYNHQHEQTPPSDVNQDSEQNNIRQVPNETILNEDDVSNIEQDISAVS